MTQRLAIRVTMDGKTPRRELMLDGYKIADLTFEEVIDFVMQATSSLRFEKH